MEHLGRVLLITGTMIAAAGLLLILVGDKLHWLGRLPGDIRIETEHVRIYIPLATMLLLSLLFTGAMWVIRHLK
ncbi:MAG: DUF2905 domain-containing protein [Chitinophagia bacterium]|nr:DUF2905 domain-containing protein [Chitinophagia bacterium]